MAHGARGERRESGAVTGRGERGQTQVGWGGARTQPSKYSGGRDQTPHRHSSSASHCTYQLLHATCRLLWTRSVGMYMHVAANNSLTHIPCKADELDLSCCGVLVCVC